MSTRPAWAPAPKTKAQIAADLRTLLKPGRRNAVRGADLALKFGMSDDRAIRDVVKDLRREGLAIGSATEQPAGFFIISNPDEKKAVLDDLRGRRAELDKDIEALETATRNIPDISQGGLF